MEEESQPGRPEFEPTEADRAWVEKCAGVGVPQEVMVGQVINPHTDLPITVKTLRKHFRKELDAGLGLYGFNIMKPAYQVATDPEHDQFSRMNIWAQKTRLGMKEISVTELVGAGGENLQFPSLVIVKDGNKDPAPGDEESAE